MGHSHVCVLGWFSFCVTRFLNKDELIFESVLFDFIRRLSGEPWRHSERASTISISNKHAFVAPSIIVWTLFHVSDWIPTEFLLQNTSYPHFFVIFLSIFNKDITVMSLLLSPHQIRLVNMFVVYFMWNLKLRFARSRCLPVCFLPNCLFNHFSQKDRLRETFEHPP